MTLPPGEPLRRRDSSWPRLDRGVFGRYAFAWLYLACYLIADLIFVLLNPHAQAALTAWASTNVANLEHEPLVPLVLSAFTAPGYLVVWPVLIALAVFGANRALGNVRTALVCLAGHVIGSLVSEGIVAYRVDAGQLAGREPVPHRRGSFLRGGVGHRDRADVRHLAGPRARGDRFRRAGVRRAHLQRPEPSSTSPRSGT